MSAAAFTRHEGWAQRLIHPVARLFMKSAAQSPATAALLAASPLAAGISGEYWSNCQIARGNPLLADEVLAKRFWDTSEQIVAAISAAHQVAPERNLMGRADRGNYLFGSIPEAFGQDFVR